VNPWTTGRSARNGGAGDSGDLTSVGVHHSLRAIAEHLWGAPSLAGRRVGIVGVGKVGARLAGHVLDEGGRVLVADSDPAAIERLVAARPDVEVAADGDAVLLADVDVVSPCALGGVLTADVVGSMQAVAVCGGANNQLADDTQAAALAARGIVYAPDFLVNAGGVVAVGAEYAGRGHYDDAAARERASRIGATLLDVLRRADAAGTTPLDAAEALAEERIAAAEPRASFEPFPA
jgi:valine dehydrogenase (NAD+)